MGHSLDSKYFPAIFDLVETQKLEGVLGCISNNTHLVQFFFRQGVLLYVSGEKAGQSPEEVLHEVLGWENFMMEWVPLQVRIAQPNINEDTLIALKDVLSILITAGKFEPVKQTVISPDFFGISWQKEAPKNVSHQPKVSPPVSSEQLEALPRLPEISLAPLEELEIAPVELKIALPTQSLAPMRSAESRLNQPKIPTQIPFSIETNLLLPPGHHQNQLEELLGTISLKEQLIALSRAHFTGYLYYHLSESLSSQGSYSLILLLDGVATDVVYHPGGIGTRLTGMPAYQALAVQKAKPQIYKVEERILKAYRALISSEKSQSNIPLTKAAFSGAMQAFKQSAKDGLILIYVDKLKLHYFFLFEGGNQVGVFGSDFKSGKLQSLSSPIALPAEDANSLMSVMLASRVERFNAETKEGSLPGAVNWGETFAKHSSVQNATSPRRQTVITELDEDDNPYGF